MSICLAPPRSPQVISEDNIPRKGSGGPRTAEGKEQSRRNSLKRGLRSRIVFPDDLADLVESRIAAFSDEFAPRCTYEAMLVRDMAVSSARFERCASLSVADLIRCADRAAYCWEQDRMTTVANFACRLSKDPQRIAQGLEGSRHGCDWLIENWELLGAIARETGRWDDDQRRLAFDMLGVPRELRSVMTRVPAGDDVAGLIALAEARVAKLREDQEAVLDDLDDAEQAMAMAGMPLEEDAATARLRKDEARARNDFAKSRNELLRFRKEQPFDESRPQRTTANDRPALADAVVETLKQEPFCTQLTPDAVVEDEVADEEEFDDNLEPAPSTSTEGPAPAGRPKTRRTRKELERRARAAARREPAVSSTR